MSFTIVNLKLIYHNYFKNTRPRPSLSYLCRECRVSKNVFF